jgi:outer membrane protein, multidrug efflux system
MLRRWSLSWLAIVGLVSCVRSARGDGTSPALPGRGHDQDELRVRIAAHAYTLDECLELAEQNFPQLWAARARLEFAHAQLDEARWTPWSQWSAQGQLGVAPPLLGTVLYPQSALGPSTQSSRNITSFQGLQPFASFGLSGVLPIYSGKIETAARAAEANVRVSEWDMERWRQQTRTDVRRTYYHLQSARDSKYLLADALDRLGKAIEGMRDRIARGDRNVSETDRLRLEVFRQDVKVQSLQADRNEANDLAALRFFTGMPARFDVADEPLRRPDRLLGPIVQYLESARLSRADVNMARAGVVARRALVDYNRARLLPDVGLGLSSSFVSEPSAAQQNNVWAVEVPNNSFFYGFAFGLRWSLDLLPQAARTQQTESQLAETRSFEDLAMGNAMWEVEKAYADAVEAKSREETWDRAEHVAKQWLVDVQSHIDIGTSDERALLEPLRSYGTARAQHVTALLDYHVAMTNLALASGVDSAAPSPSGP